MIPRTTPRSPNLGLYIHIPFCRARCGYCDFVTFTGKEDKIDTYVEDLCKEIEMSSYPAVAHRHDRPNADRFADGPCFLPEAESGGGRVSMAPPLASGGVDPPPVAVGDDGFNISTIFFGGGTPSLLEATQVAQILSAVRSYFSLDPGAEITLEANPESIGYEKAKGWRQAGVNRLSIGLQVFDNELLKRIDRLHTAEEFRAAYQAVRQAGFDNVSVDLIYGFEGQSLASWQTTLQLTAALGPEHLSLYALKVEEHTPFAAKGLRVDEDLEAEMYEWARGYLSEEGYEQYEISNFSRPGRSCRHNLLYWRQEDYLGLGVGAVGCVQGVRWENQKTLHAYHEDLRAGHLPRASQEILEEKTRRFERLMLGLRLREGLDWRGDSPDWISHRSTLSAKGLLEEIRPGRWRIPDRAVALTNQILLPFI